MERALRSSVLTFREGVTCVNVTEDTRPAEGRPPTKARFCVAACTRFQQLVLGPPSHRPSSLPTLCSGARLCETPRTPVPALAGKRGSDLVKCHFHRSDIRRPLLLRLLLETLERASSWVAAVGPGTWSLLSGGFPVKALLTQGDMFNTHKSEIRC